KHPGIRRLRGRPRGVGGGRLGKGGAAALRSVPGGCRNARHRRLHLCRQDTRRRQVPRYACTACVVAQRRRGSPSRQRGRRQRLHRQGRVRPGAFPRHDPPAGRLIMSRLRVLVVEDSATVRRRMVEILAGDADIEVIGEAADGKDAIALAQRLRPDIVTLDMMLPVMTGLAATEYIMAHCPVPILIVSASTNRGELHRTYDALAAGAVDVLEKPTRNEPPGHWEARFLAAVKRTARIKVITHPRARLHTARPALPPRDGSAIALVAVGASTGGPAAML